MITLDNRTGSKELLPRLAPFAELARLDYGDISFTGSGPGESLVSIGLERKTIGDLCDSMRTGRLSGHQLIGLINSYWKVYILVEGNLTLDRSGNILHRFRIGNRTETRSMGMPYTAIYTYLNTLEVIAGVTVVRTHNTAQTAGVIRALYNWWQKPYDSHRAHLGFHHSLPVTTAGVPLTPPTLVQRLAKELKGVGWERSASLSDRYAAPLDLVLASREDLMKVPGIGKELADSILKELRDENPTARKPRKAKTS